MFRFAMLLFAVLGFYVTPVQSAWGPRGCSPVGDKAQWTFRAEDNLWYLQRSGQTEAVYYPDQDTYRTYNPQTRTWGDEQDPPWGKRTVAKPEEPAGKCCKCSKGCKCKCKCECEKAGAKCSADCTCVKPVEVGAVLPAVEIENFGLDLSQLGKNEQYSIGDKKLTRAEAMEAIGGQIPNDAGKLRLTVIGAEPERKKLIHDLDQHEALKDFRGRYLVQSYEPTEWPVTRQGFYAQGKPTVYLQDASGKVLHRQDDYSDGAEGLAKALRKADPSYKPEADPDQRKTLPLDLPDWAKDPQVLILGGLVAAALLLHFFYRKRQ